MKLFVVICFLIVVSSLIGQDNSINMRQIAKDLTVQLSRQNVKKLAITRLDYAGNPDSEIGRYFADELVYAFMQQGVDFEIVPLDQVEEAMSQYEQKQKQKANQHNNSSTTSQPANTNTNNSGNNQKTNWALIGGATAAIVGITLLSKDRGPLPKVSHLALGTIVDQGDELLVTYNVVTNKKDNSLVAISKAKFLKTSDIVSVLDQGTTRSIPQERSTESDGNVIIPPPPPPPPPPVGNSWRNNSIVMEMKSCYQSGQNIECELQVTARENDINFGIYNFETVLFAGENQKEFRPFEVVIGEFASTGYKTEKKLIAKYNVKLTLRFNQINQRIKNIALLYIRCGDSSSGNYSAEFRSVPVY